MNKSGSGISEELLNALVDNEFTPDEQAEKLGQVRRDKVASAELCHLRELKESVRLAYADPPQPKLAPHKKKLSPIPYALAASLVLFIIGILLGHNPTLQLPQSAGERFILLDPIGQGDRPATASDKSMRVVFHVQNIVQVTPGELLDEVESLLEDFHKRGETIRVEVVAHGEGLGLLRSKLSTEQQRISQMVKAYPTLTFVACRNTIQRLKVEKGIEVLLLPEATTTESGVAHVVRRQNEGWIYIQV
jgi:intracellular sulfur oxidation DsrE/DsrF family protein